MGSHADFMDCLADFGGGPQKEIVFEDVRLKSWAVKFISFSWTPHLFRVLVYVRCRIHTTLRSGFPGG